MATNNVKAKDESTQLNNNPTNYASFKPAENFDGMLIRLIRIIHVYSGSFCQ